MTGFVWTRSTRSVVPMGKATAPLVSPGVLFGESVFETLRVRNGSIFQLSRHIGRLQGAIRELEWGIPPSREDIESGLRAVLAEAGRVGRPGPYDDLRVRVTALRVDEVGRLECFVQAVPYTPPSKEQYEAGVHAVVTDVRLIGGAHATRFKLGNRFLFRRARDQARRAGAWEGLLLNSNGFLADGAVANIHLIRDGRVFAPSLDAGALPGIAQAAVRESADHLDIPWEWGSYPPSLLAEADEAFLTNALVGVLPLTVVDGRPVGNGRPGPIANKLAAAYAERVARESRSLPG